MYQPENDETDCINETQKTDDCCPAAHWHCYWHMHMCQDVS